MLLGRNELFRQGFKTIWYQLDLQKKGTAIIVAALATRSKARVGSAEN